MAASEGYCSNCGATSGGGNFCSSCGARLPGAAAPAAPDAATTAPPGAAPATPAAPSSRFGRPALIATVILAAVLIGGGVYWLVAGKRDPSGSQPPLPAAPSSLSGATSGSATAGEQRVIAPSISARSGAQAAQPPSNGATTSTAESSTSLASSGSPGRTTATSVVTRASVSGETSTRSTPPTPTSGPAAPRQVTMTASISDGTLFVNSVVDGQTVDTLKPPTPGGSPFGPVCKPSTSGTICLVGSTGAHTYHAQVIQQDSDGAARSIGTITTQENLELRGSGRDVFALGVRVYQDAGTSYAASPRAFETWTFEGNTVTATGCGPSTDSPEFDPDDDPTAPLTGTCSSPIEASRPLDSVGFATRAGTSCAPPTTTQ